MSRFDDTLATIDRLNRADSGEQLCRELIDIARPHGFNSVVAATVPMPGAPSSEQRDHVLLCDWPREWLERYVAMNYVDHDPLVKWMKRYSTPVRWSEAAQKLGKAPEARRVFGDAGSYDLNDGLGFTLYSLEGHVVMVSFGGAAVDIEPKAFDAMSLIAHSAVIRAMQLAGLKEAASERVALTERERECMRWAALGKSEWEISQILGISEHTSEKHLLNAKAKLGAVNRVQAVAEAIRLGYIA